MIAAGAVLALVLLAGVFALGRSTAPEPKKPVAVTPSATRTVGGVTVGVLQTRAGALAAADNYVTTIAGSQFSDPDRFRTFVQTVYIPSAQRQALSESGRVSDAAVNTAAFYRDGGRKVTMTAARRLRSYGGGRAVVETWLCDVLWGPGEEPRQNWQLVSTSLQWDQGAWRIVTASRMKTPGPAPAIVLRDGGEDTRAFFDKNLAGMTQPVYGAG